MLDIIKEYLVSIGADVDRRSFEEAEGSINKIGKSVVGFATSSGSSFAKATASMSTFFIALDVGIAKYMHSVAQADLETDKFARSMWMNKDAAMAYKSSMDALGATLQDLYLSPELMQRYTQLQKQAMGMRAPKEFSEQMKQIRSITFEFQRMRLEATYAMQWIAYYLFKYLQKPINDVKLTLQSLNDRIVKDMPRWTKQVAEVISWFVRLGTTGVKAWGDVIRLFKALPTETKIAAGAFAGLFALIKMGPIGWLIAGLTTILLLLDDFETYKSGGKSLFEGLWKQLEEKEGMFSENGPFGKIKGAINSVEDAIDSLFKKMDKAEIPQNFAEALGMIAGSSLELAGTIWTVLNQLSQLAGFDDFGDLVTTNIIDVIERATNVMKGFAKLLDVINKELKGDFKGAWESIKDEWDYFGKAIVGESEEDKKSKKKDSEQFTDPKSFMDNFMKGFNETYGDELSKYKNPSSNKNVPSNSFGDFLQKFNNTNKGNAVTQSYIYPRTDVKNSFSPHIENNYNIHGSESSAIARAVQRTQADNNDVMIRAFQGRWT